MKPPCSLLCPDSNTSTSTSTRLSAAKMARRVPTWSPRSAMLSTPAPPSIRSVESKLRSAPKKKPSSPAPPTSRSLPRPANMRKSPSCSAEPSKSSRSPGRSSLALTVSWPDAAIMTSALAKR
jgi:hypothetical protein